MNYTVANFKLDLICLRLVAFSHTGHAVEHLSLLQGWSWGCKRSWSVFSLHSAWGKPWYTVTPLLLRVHTIVYTYRLGRTFQVLRTLTIILLCTKRNIFRKSLPLLILTLLHNCLQHWPRVRFFLHSECIFCVNVVGIMQYYVLHFGTDTGQVPLC